MRTRSLLLVSVILFTAAVSGDGQKSYTPWSAPVNLGTVVNTARSEVFVCISKDGLSLYFSSLAKSGDGVPRPNLGGWDIYVTERASLDAPWGEPMDLPAPINSPYDDVAPMLSIDGHHLYFSSNRPGGFGASDIYVARRHNKRDNEHWQEPVNLGEGVNSPSAESCPWLSEDETTGVTTLYFDSNRPDGPGPYVDDGSLGGTDIYTSELQADETFGPAALVTELSTTSMERHVTIRRDGLEMILQSNRPGRLGNLDLWMSTRTSTAEPWSTPVNLGDVINGPHGGGSASGAQIAGAAFSFDGLSLYFGASKNAHPGSGAYDIVVSTRSVVKGPEQDEK